MTYALRATGILLAAGFGTRFDPSGVHSKLLAKLPDGTPVAVAAAQRLAAVLPNVIAVVRPSAEKLARLLNGVGCQVVFAPDAVRGMGASLAAGVGASADSPGWIVALADMPWIAPATIEAVARTLEAAGSASIVAPAYRGQRGHPVGFARRHGEALAALDGDSGARALLAANPPAIVDVDDAAVLRDVDTPADLPGSMPPG
ncbi:nucleotidyltransferase family protein [Burkholderia sp. TSV86]|uniref:nucleotidyltransferase family protein n=1 Tax=Burkholderia sp. TSV86 TaxID=1385594 RepID=UPI00075B9DA4|nr:nucleotidyltransferase family protein [Burkholderia sp. TSV86]KVE36452.1 molybdopterin-guanine dinucleotide biosynthesis protein MobA [Burkholderia sp. TSV86]